MTTMMQGSPPIAPSRPLSPSLLSYESEIFWHTLIQTGPPLAFDLKNILKNYSLNEWYFDEAIIFYVPGLLIFPDASEHACWSVKGSCSSSSKLQVFAGFPLIWGCLVITRSSSSSMKKYREIFLYKPIWMWILTMETRFLPILSAWGASPEHVGFLVSGTSWSFLGSSSSCLESLSLILLKLELELFWQHRT